MSLFYSCIQKPCRILQQRSISARARKFWKLSSNFDPQKILILNKVSRYEFMKLCNPTLDDTSLKQKLLEHGSDYDAILQSHNKNKETQHRTLQVLEKLDIEFKVIDRFNIKPEAVEWADLVLPIGGDGTFLLAANLIKDNQKPIIGINSDPSSSEGHLLLPPKFTDDIEGIFKYLRRGYYKKVMRTRIRITLKGDNVWAPISHLHEKRLTTGDKRFLDVDAEERKDTKERRLPWFALNEVFIGESHSARTSFLLMNTGEDDEFHKVMSSGLCVSTGTGSTSWFKTINALDAHKIQDVLIAAKCNSFFTDSHFDQIRDDYNKNLEFPPVDSKMNYSIRDMIVHKKYRFPKSMSPRGFSEKLTVRSLCLDACLVLDAGIVVPFNAGTSAVLETHPDDSLMNLVLVEY